MPPLGLIPKEGRVEKGAAESRLTEQKSSWVLQPPAEKPLGLQAARPRPHSQVTASLSPVEAKGDGVAADKGRCFGA